jgi:hypothetical protein
MLVLCADGLIPGVVYGKDNDGNDQRIMITIPHLVLAREVRNMKKRYVHVYYVMYRQCAS